MLGQVPRSRQLAVVHLTTYKSWDPSMSAGGAGLTAVLCTYPLDLARARMVGGPVTPQVDHGFQERVFRDVTAEK